jgi:hypothetical protein
MAANRFQSREALAFKEKRVGTISGFRFPMHGWSLVTGLRKLFTELTTFSDLNPRGLQSTALQRWAHWAEDFDDNLAKVAKATEDGTNFFSPANFQLFAVLAPSDAMKARLRTLQVSDIRPPRAAISHHLPRPVSTPKRGLRGDVSPRELRRLTGSKKIQNSRLRAVFSLAHGSGCEHSHPCKPIVHFRQVLARCVLHGELRPLLCIQRDNDHAIITGHKLQEAFATLYSDIHRLLAAGYPHRYPQTPQKGVSLPPVVFFLQW